MITFLNKKKYIMSILLFSLIILTAIFLIFSSDRKTNLKNFEYIKSIGWQINENPNEISHYKIPEEFNEIFTAYNEIQKKAGFDLLNYKGKTITSYSYKITNHRLSEICDVYATVLVYQGEIIGGEISSKGENNFIYEITNTTDLISG